MSGDGIRFRNRWLVNSLSDSNDTKLVRMESLREYDEVLPDVGKPGTKLSIVRRTWKR